MAYQEVTTTSYGKRVGNSFKGIGGGIIMFIAATVLLWWNEGRAVKTDKMLNEAEGVTEELSTINRIDPDMDGHLVYATGMTTTEDSLSDTKFGVGAKAVRLTRTVEYYQEQEHAEEEHKDKFGGKGILYNVHYPINPEDVKEKGCDYVAALRKAHQSNEY